MKTKREKRQIYGIANISLATRRSNLINLHTRFLHMACIKGSPGYVCVGNAVNNSCSLISLSLFISFQVPTRATNIILDSEEPPEMEKKEGYGNVGTSS